MNIAIITQPIKANYGGVLQNYALQKTLIRLGHNPITIDYRDSTPLWFYLLQTFKTILLYPFPSKRRKLTPYRNVFPRDNRIMHFVQKYINLTEKQYLSYKKDVVDEYGIKAVIVGSDQVWRPQYSPGCLYDTYLSFLKNIDIIKLSYAASFGVDKWEYSDEQTKKCKDLVRYFNAVSVRENTGIDLCQKFLGVQATWVLDPTLLLSKEDYLLTCSNIPMNTKKYVCSYMLDADSQKINTIQKFAHDHDCELIVFSAHNSIKYSIEEWLALFRDATYVITDSFHGTVFSIIFQKEFYTLLNADRGATRFESMLSQFGLESRITTDITSHTQIINWSEVENKRKSLIELSVKFLQDGLS